MRWIRPAFVGATVLVTAFLGSAAAQTSRPSCRQVLSQVNKQVNEHEGNPASPRAVARVLGTETEWVIRCMEAYGRVPSNRKGMQDADREAFERALEEGRPKQTDDENQELRYEQEQQLRVERQEQRQHQKKLAQQKDFDDSAESFAIPLNQY